MDGNELARFVDADGQGWILEPEQRAALIEDVFDSPPRASSQRGFKDAPCASANPERALHF